MRRGECSGENVDAMGLLQKKDSVDVIKPTGAAGKPDTVKLNAADSASSSMAGDAGVAEINCNREGEQRGRTALNSIKYILYSIVSNVYIFCKANSVTQSGMGQ